MGTRSVTHFMNDHEHTIVRLYRQFDGYPTGHGKDLADFLNGFRIVNGYSYEDRQQDKVANGMGCLAAQTIAYFKNGIGGFYIVDGNDCWQDYDYLVKLDGDGKLWVKIVGFGEKTVLDWSSVEDFREYCITTVRK